MINQKIIAKKAGVSQSTVSLVLNNKPARISEKTRQRILDIARIEDFCINASGRDLARKRTLLLGILLPEIDDFYSDFIKGITELAEKKGFDVITCFSWDLPKKERRYIDWMREKRVEGIILFPTGSNKTFLKKLSRTRFPIVFLHRYIKGINTNYVGIDNLKSGYLMTKYLIEKGYRRISFVSKSQNISTIRDRLKGYTLAMEESGLERHLDWIKINRWDPNIGLELGKHISNRRHRPEAIFAINDHVAYGVIKGLSACGLRVPEDLGVSSYGNFSLNWYMEKKLTTIGFNRVDIGHGACELLVDNINEKTTKPQPQTRIFQSNLIIGETT
jgi:LacI family transcriptional regulator